MIALLCGEAWMFECDKSVRGALQYTVLFNSAS